jgi:hypothetical protein
MSKSRNNEMPNANVMSPNVNHIWKKIKKKYIWHILFSSVPVIADPAAKQSKT